MGKFFTTTVKPTMLAAKMDSGAYSADDVLFDWFAFDVPKGTSKLTGVTALVRGNDGAAQMVPFDVVFAKSDANGDAPSSLGTEHATADGTGFYNNLLGLIRFAASDYGQKSLDTMAIANVAAAPPLGFALTPEPLSGTNDGYDKLYVGGLSGGAFNFASTVALTGAHDAAAANDLTVDGKDARLVLAPGDVIIAQDEAAIGTVASIPDATSVILKAGTTNTAALLEDDELYNQSPITLILTFER